MSDLTVTQHAPGIWEMTLQRPERMNALSVAAVAAMRAAVDEASRAGARVMLIRGTGKAFSAGADLKERQGMDLAGKLAHNQGIRAAIDAVGGARFISIALINGLAMGGGLELALGCDLRLAAAGVQIGLTESRIGAFPGAGGTQRLPRVIGASRALQMMLLGEPIRSERALEIGLVNEVVDAEQLLPRGLELAGQLAARSAPALATIKRLVYQGLELPLSAALQVERAAVPAILASRDYAEGLAAFAEKRPPRFTDSAD